MRRSVPLLFLILSSSSLAAQDAAVDSFLPARSREADVPSPEAFFGRPLGERYTEPGEVQAYARAVAAASDRVSFETYGTTWAGRPLSLVTISAPGNLRRADRIREAAAGIRHGGDVPQDLPVTVWFGMSVHGDEGSGVEAGLALLYHLASSRDPDVAGVLEACLAIIDLDQNPDGRARMTIGARDRAAARSGPPGAGRDGGRQTEPDSWDNVQPWPGGRTNRYLFDLNRDWFLQTQVETQVKVRRVLAQAPQVLADFHEMQPDRSTYFSTPPAPPLNPFISKSVQEGWEKIGAALGSAFDARAWPWWMGDTFPADYPGFGGSWPCFLGIVGMTFEEATPRGGAVERADGSVQTLSTALMHHAVAGWTTLQVAAGDRAGFLERQRAHFSRIAEQGQADARPWFCLSSRGDPLRLSRLAEVLRANGIESLRLPAGVELEAAPLTGGEPRPVTLPAGSLAVSTRQWSRQLLLALFEPEIAWDPKFIEAEQERLEGGREGELYDVTAWNLPLQFGVETWRAARLPELPAGTGPAAGRGAADLSDPQTVAWLIDGASSGAAGLVAWLLDQGLSVGCVPFGFRAANLVFPPGAFVVVQARNDESVLRRTLAALPAGPSAVLQPVTSFRTDEGHDLGSGRVIPLARRKILVACGPGTDPYSAGAVRWLLEQALPVRHVNVGLAELDRLLPEADVLVLPDGDYPAGPQRKTLATFLDAGGTIVALGGALTALATGPEGGLLGLVDRGVIEKRTAFRGPIVRARFQGEPWIGLGMDPDLAVQARAQVTWTPLEVPDLRVLAAFADDHETPLLLSGIIFPMQREALAGAPFIVERKHGKGRVIAFTEDPVVRGASPGLWAPFLNALLLPSR